MPEKVLLVSSNLNLKNKPLLIKNIDQLVSLFPDTSSFNDPEKYFLFGTEHGAAGFLKSYLEAGFNITLCNFNDILTGVAELNEFALIDVVFQRFTDDVSIDKYLKLGIKIINYFGYHSDWKHFQAYIIKKYIKNQNIQIPKQVFISNKFTLHDEEFNKLKDFFRDSEYLFLKSTIGNQSKGVLPYQILHRDQIEKIFPTIANENYLLMSFVEAHQFFYNANGVFHKVNFMFKKNKNGELQWEPISNNAYVIPNYVDLDRVRRDGIKSFPEVTHRVTSEWINGDISSLSQDFCDLSDALSILDPLGFITTVDCIVSDSGKIFYLESSPGWLFLDTALTGRAPIDMIPSLVAEPLVTTALLKYKFEAYLKEIAIFDNLIQSNGIIFF